MESLTYLPCFKPRSYPSPVLSVAKDHPVYINGTKLVNGSPVLTGNKTDESRIDEFKAQGFSKGYIQELTDSSFYSYYFGTGIKGSKCNYGSSLPYKPSYAKITEKTVLDDPVNDLVKHVVEIIDYRVLFNGVVIASAPLPFTGKLKGKSQWTPSRRLTFCKAVVFGIIPGEIKTGDYHVKVETKTDDLYFRELIAKYPAVIDNQIDDVKEEMMDKIAINALPGIIAVSPIEALIVAPAEPIAVSEHVAVELPEQLSAYTNEAITGYPETSKALEATMTNQNWLEIEDRENAIIDIARDIEEDVFYPVGSGYEFTENEDEISQEKIMFELVNPAIVQNPANIIRSWTLPYLRCSIVEEVRA